MQIHLNIPSLLARNDHDELNTYFKFYESYLFCFEVFLVRMNILASVIVGFMVHHCVFALQFLERTCQAKKH